MANKQLFINIETSLWEKMESRRIELNLTRAAFVRMIIMEFLNAK